MRRLTLCALLSVSTVLAAPKALDPEIKKIVDAVSSERIAAIEKKLESFATRNVNTFDTPGERGIGAAGRWIYSEFKSYSPRLEVRYDKHRVKKQGRIQRDIELTNIVAVLPGTQNKERQFIISGHYDSVVMPKGSEDRLPSDDALKAAMAKYDQPAPGVTDDASGTAAVMELARVMSGHEFKKTIVFIAFAGEEMGLVGSSLYALDARNQNQIIDGVLNNDIIGSEVAGNGFIDNGRVRVFSEDPNDSQSRQIARYMREIGERYVPSMKVELVFRADRFGRGGDHTPFNQQQYPAVRITTPNENYANQHTITDTFENTSVAYATRVAKVNAAALASLALAPKAPLVDRVIDQGERKGQITPMITRGKSGYDAVLKWKNENPEPDLAGYVVVVRSTTAPDWEREIFAGNVDTFTLENTSIDDVVFGVKAVDKDGHESLVSAYTFRPRALRKIETW
jgi:hypothetical protein